MKEPKHYFSLVTKGGHAGHRNGERMLLTERVVNIGETPDCDVRYETDCPQPEYYASIVRNDDGKSWRIVKRTQYMDILIDGKGSIGYACALKDGDIIRFEGQSMALCFHSHYDNRYDGEYRNNIWKWVAAGFAVLVTALALILSMSYKQGSINARDISSLEKSVYLLKVDSVCRIQQFNGKEEFVAPMLVLAEDIPTGTAFLTTDGKLVTARHCVEYWLGTNLDLTVSVADMDENDVVRWAIEAETFNQMHSGDSTMRLKVFFSVFDGSGEKRYSFTSTDKQVHYNTDNDGVFLLADFTQDYYWRSIRPYFADRRMELDDILWIDGLSEKGRVKQASREQLDKVKNGTKLMICGFPVTGFGDKRMTFTEGTICRDASAENENIFFESNINHGFSGGPVLMKNGSDVVVIGVVSRVDSVSSGLYKWAVPILAVNNDQNKERKDKSDE